MVSKKAVAYIRISSTRQIDNESPETQREIIQRYALSQNIEVVEWFYDEAKSGKNAEREELKNMLNFALKYKGKIDHVIVYKMNRASRDLESYTIKVRMVLQSKGITVRSATEPVDDTKMGRFMESFLVLMGQLDNESKAEVTIHNMKSLAEQGFWQHPPIVGYEIEKIPNDRGQLRPTLKKSVMAPKIKLVLERFSEGNMSKAALTRYAAEIGLKSRYGNNLSEDRIHRLIKNPTYAGYVSDKFTNYELVPGKHPAIISDETYFKNQSLLYPKKSRIGEVHKSKNEAYPLRGFIKCINCKNYLYASAPRTGNGQMSPRYHCARNSCKGKVPSVKANIVHEEFSELLKVLQPSDGLLKLYRRVLVNEANRALENLNRNISNYRTKLDKIAELRSSAINSYIEGNLTLTEKDEYLADLDKQKIQISADLIELEQQQAIREADIDQAILFMKTVRKQWEISDIDLRQRFQNLIFPEGLVYDSKKHKFGTSEISAFYRCISIKKGSEEPSESALVAGGGLEPPTLWL